MHAILHASSLYNGGWRGADVPIRIAAGKSGWARLSLESSFQRGKMNNQPARKSDAPRDALGDAQMDVCAVLADVLIEKGIVTQGELLDRLRQAQAGGRGLGAARVLAGIVAHLEPEERSAAASQRLDGETVLVVEEDPAMAERMLAILERAGAEAMLARGAEEALARLAQFDFSAAVLDWRPERNEHRAVTRWLRGDGVRILFHAAHPPEDVVSACGDPILVKPAPATEIVGALARLTGTGGGIERTVGAA
jgi:CheY-like chemotaxis protein